LLVGTGEDYSREAKRKKKWSGGGAYSGSKKDQG